MPVARQRHARFFAVTPREARGHALLLAALLWGMMAALFLYPPGLVDAFGHIKGTDFVHFYALGRAARQDAADILYDQAALHALQVESVPASVAVDFLPVYPPQTALLYAPFARLSYPWSLAAWNVATLMIYLAGALAARARWPTAFRDGRLVLSASLAFPPVVYLMLHGQSTAVPLLAFLLAWLALERRRRFAAGLALGLLAIKPQLGLVLVVLAACGEWQVLAGASLSVVLQMGTAAAWFGPEVLPRYLEALVHAGQQADRLEPRPDILQSIAAVTRLLPAPLSTLLWALLSAAIAWRARAVWQGASPVAARFAVLIIASVLVSPHVNLYDATILALPLLLVGGWLTVTGSNEHARYWQLVYGLTLALIVPVAALIKLQLSVVLLALLFWRASAIMLPRTFDEDRASFRLTSEPRTGAEVASPRQRSAGGPSDASGNG